MIAFLYRVFFMILQLFLVSSYSYTLLWLTIKVRELARSDQRDKAENNLSIGVTSLLSYA